MKNFYFCVNPCKNCFLDLVLNQQYQRRSEQSEESWKNDCRKIDSLG